MTMYLVLYLTICFTLLWNVNHSNAAYSVQLEYISQLTILQTMLLCFWALNAFFFGFRHPSVSILLTRLVICQFPLSWKSLVQSIIENIKSLITLSWIMLSLTWLFVWGSQSRQTELLRLLLIIQDQRDSFNVLDAAAALRHETQLETQKTHCWCWELELQTVYFRDQLSFFFHRLNIY